MTNIKSWRDQIKVHPAADLFPMMPPDELKALGEDIKETWLRTNIAVWQADEGRPWFLLDGRNRLDAAELVGLSVEFIKRAGEVTVKIGEHIWAVDDITSMDPYEWVVSANVHRRHLTHEQKRDVIAKLLKAQPGKSNREIARQVKDDHHKVGAVRRGLEATGQVSPVEKTTGKDGKARTTAPRKRRHIDLAATALTNADAPGPAPQANFDVSKPSEFDASIDPKELGRTLERAVEAANAFSNKSNREPIPERRKKQIAKQVEAMREAVRELHRHIGWEQRRHKKLIDSVLTPVSAAPALGDAP